MSKSNALLRIYADIKNKNLLLFQDDQVVRHYPILQLKENLPTGKFTILEKIPNPNPSLGSRWIGFGSHLMGIHGGSGEKGSCSGIRLENCHLEDLYALAPLETSIEISKMPCEFDSVALPNQFGRFPATPLAFPLVPGPHSYIIQRGDTIWKLSRRYKIPMENILACNLLPDPNRLEPGQIINLPLAWPKK